MKKAQNFYEEIKAKGEISDEDYLNCIRALCFGVVIEGTEELYKQSQDETDEELIDDEEPIDRVDCNSVHISSTLQNRIIRNYLNGNWCSQALLSMITKYYFESGIFVKEQYSAEYKVFCDVGKDNNFYKTESEIRDIILKLSEKIKKVSSEFELYGYTDAAFTWSKQIDEPADTLADSIREAMKDIVKNYKSLDIGKSFYLPEDYSFVDHQEYLSDTIREITREFNEEEIKRYVDDLYKSMYGPNAVENSNQLRMLYESGDLSESTRQYCWKLLRDASFPIDNMTREKYNACYNVLYILRKMDQSRYDKFVDELLQRCDKMAAYRIKVINSRIDENSIE